MALFTVVFVVALIDNFLSLYYVAQKSRLWSKRLFSNPAFLLGDFFLIPLYFGVLAFFVEANYQIIRSLNPMHLLLISIFAALVTLLFGLEFRMLRPIWIPHGIFHWLVVFSFSLLAFITFYNSLPISLLAVCTGLLFTHQILGFIYSKKLTPNR